MPRPFPIVLSFAAALALLPATVRAEASRAERMAILDAIRVVDTSIEPLASTTGGKRFALTCSFVFPRTSHYVFYPAYVGSGENKVFANYFKKVDPASFEHDKVFEAGKPYRFTLVVDTEGKALDFARDKAHVQVADGQGTRPLAMRTIDIGLEGVPAAFAANPAPVRTEPAAPDGNALHAAEQSIRITDLAIHEAAVKTGEAIVFTYNISNVGSAPVSIPHGDFGNVVSVMYQWEPLSDSAKQTKSSVSRSGNRYAAGGEFPMQILSSSPDRSFAPGEKEPKVGRVRPFQPLLPGDYRLHVSLYSRFSTMPEPVQGLSREFRILP